MATHTVAPRLVHTAAIAAAANLEELLLYKNKISTVDPAIGQLKKLKVLNLFNQGVLAKLPWPELGGLISLEELNLAANKISVIPDAAFAQLAALKVLHCIVRCIEHYIVHCIITECIA